jgi:uncharacterized protein YfcZ (UPF0381/DUF406 family)
MVMVLGSRSDMDTTIDSASCSSVHRIVFSWCESAREKGEIKLNRAPRRQSDPSFVEQTVIAFLLNTVFIT